MKYLIAIAWFIVFTKLFIFWAWLWQLKEYHWGRFKAFFETQLIRKVFFSLHGLRYPKLTKKIIAILATGIVLEIIFLILIFNSPYFVFYLIASLLLVLDITTVIVFIFQIPTNIYIKKTLGEAKEKREEFKDLTVIGIAGSYGKTAVKEFLYEILSDKFKTLKTEKHINAEIGIAKTILEKLNQEHQILITEIGAYERGKIKEVCDIVKPKIGILTGINEQHLSTFGSMENTRKAKYEIIDCIPKDGIKIVKDQIDLEAEELIIDKESLSFKIKGVDFKVNLLGGHNIENLLLAIYCALKLGMSLEEIAQACSKIKPEQGSMKIIRRNPIVLDASYSANPTGVMADLEYLKMYMGKRVVVMPCLIELNGRAKEIHKKIADKLEKVSDLAIITTRDYYKEMKRNNIILIEDPQEIIKKIKEFNPDVVLLEGRVPREIIK